MKQTKALRHLKLAFFLNLGFTVFELIGGFYTNSVALLSDAIHDFGDSLSIGLSFLMENKAQKKPDQEYTYGYARYSLLGGLISSAVLLVGVTIVLFETIPRILHPEAIDAQGLIVFAIVGVLVNGAAAFVTRKGDSINERVISLHLFEDVFGWIALLIGAIAMNLWNIPWLDAALAAAFSLYILYHVFRNIQSVMQIFLEKAPKGITEAIVTEAIVDHRNVVSIHHLHLWSLEGQIVLMTMHAVLSDTLSIPEITQVKDIIHQKMTKLGVHHLTLEIEFAGSDCPAADCDELESPSEAHHHH